MKRLDLVTMIILLLAIAMTTSGSVAAQAPAGPPSSIQLEAVVAQSFGSTSYEMTALAPDPRDPQTLVDIRSKLEFPLNATVAGARIVWHPRAGNLQRWQFSAELLTNLADPGDRMIDQDFVDGREVIHTESDAQLDMWLAALDAEYVLRAGERTSLSLLLGVDYQKIDQYIVGYEGWQKSLFSDQVFDISSTEPALDYALTYISPQVGAGLWHKLGSFTRLGLRGSAGILFASDTDDHILRDRKSEGSGTGVSLGTQADLELMPGFLSARWLSVRLTAALKYLYAEGGMDQTFANGNRYTDLPYTFESIQPRIGVSAAASF